MPPPSRNATGLAAYGQLARNLADNEPWSVPGYRYRPSHDNPVRIAMWKKRRWSAVQYVYGLSKSQPGKHRSDLARAYPFLLLEHQKFLEPLSALYPVGQDPAAARDPDRIAKAQKLLREAQSAHRAAMKALYRAAVADLDLPEALREILEAPAEPSPERTKAYLEGIGHELAGIRVLCALRLGDGPADPAVVTALVLHVDDPHLLVAEAALASLVRLSPPELSETLAGLMGSCPRETRKELADGPIQRQILFALAGQEDEAATTAIAEAILDDGALDDVPPAISRWAATLLRERLGEKAKPALLRAFESDVPHVREHALFHLVDLGAKEVLPALKERTDPASLTARVRLGDETALATLFAHLEDPDRSVRSAAVNGLMSLGPTIEPKVLERIAAGGSVRLLANCGYVLSAVGTEKSIPVLEELAKRQGVAPHATRALQMLKARLAGD
jgi:HEAT repeat protein